MKPLVTVICICYNHERFLAEALDSVRNQTYPNLEILLVDDQSTDNSRALIRDYLKQHPEIKYLPNEKNAGVCASFNRAFALSKGDYIVDFATDDVLMPDRIARQVAAFEQLDAGYGVIYTDAELIDEAGKSLGNYYKRDRNGNLKQNLPQGDVFAAVLKRHFLSPPTLLVRRGVYEKLGGYDETLAYEDFDFWVRSSRDFKYFYLDAVLTRRRVHKTQLSQKQYTPSDKQIFSTISVCRKARQLVKNEEEKAALVTRVQLELVQAILSENKAAGKMLFNLLKELEGNSTKFKFLNLLSALPLPLVNFRQLYYRFKYSR